MCDFFNSTNQLLRCNINSLRLVYNLYFQLQGRHLLGITQATAEENISLMNTIKRREGQEQTKGQIHRKISQMSVFSHIIIHQKFPHNLRMWGKEDVSSYKQCGRTLCTLTLCNLGWLSQNTGRGQYRWRYD